MKQFTRVCLIICGVLAALGLMFCIVGACLGFGVPQIIAMARDGAFTVHWGDNDVDLSLWDTPGGTQEPPEGTDEDWSHETKTFSGADVRKLDIEFDFGTLRIEPSESGDIEVEMNYRSIWGTYSRKVGCGLDGGALKIRDTVQKPILRLFTHDTKDAVLTVRIPADVSFEAVNMDVGGAYVSVGTVLSGEKMDISIGAGEMVNTADGTAALQADSINLEIGAGHMSLNGLEARKLDVECGAGQMELRNVTAQNIDAECGLGQLTMVVNGEEKEYNYEVDCGIGRVAVGSFEYSGLGNSKEINNGGSRNMSIDCGIGEVIVTFEK